MTRAPRILIHDSDPEPMLARLSRTHPEAALCGHDSYDGLQAVLAAFRPDIAYSIAFNGRDGFPRDSLLGPHGPGWIAVGGSGVDHLTPWDTSRTTVTNAAGVAAAMIAEYVLGALLHFTLDMPGLAADQAARHWNPKRRVEPLHGKTMLIVGLGHTGQAVAARARGFGLHVLGTRARPQPVDNVDEVHGSDALPGLWGRADVIVLSVPLLSATRGLVDARALAAMKDSALLVDVSRGGVLQADALADALRDGHLRGAALDVFAAEPLPADSPLWGLDNLLISPHCSAVHDGWTMQSFDLFLDNLHRWQTGTALINIVDPDRGY